MTDSAPDYSYTFSYITDNFNSVNYCNGDNYTLSAGGLTTASTAFMELSYTNVLNIETTLSITFYTPTLNLVNIKSDYTFLFNTYCEIVVTPEAPKISSSYSYAIEASPLVIAYGSFQTAESCSDAVWNQTMASFTFNGVKVTSQDLFTLDTTTN